MLPLHVFKIRDEFIQAILIGPLAVKEFIVNKNSELNPYLYTYM